ncbi:hypothetical protein [Burkholderia ubonensis]|uniref:hypothetical protein n=1 Tax=Burkholderia ubonensis TaxID=101571 RepID=UPI00116032FC|nr:hypothetical protein [Burkholderia ubonensis]
MFLDLMGGDSEIGCADLRIVTAVDRSVAMLAPFASRRGVRVPWTMNRAPRHRAPSNSNEINFRNNRRESE